MKWSQAIRRCHRARYWRADPEDALWIVVVLLGIFCAGVFVINCVRGPN